MKKIRACAALFFVTAATSTFTADNPRQPVQQELEVWLDGNLLGKYPVDVLYQSHAIAYKLERELDFENLQIEIEGIAREDFDRLIDLMRAQRDAYAHARRIREESALSDRAIAEVNAQVRKVIRDREQKVFGECDLSLAENRRRIAQMFFLDIIFTFTQRLDCFVQQLKNLSEYKDDRFLALYRNLDDNEYIREFTAELIGLLVERYSSLYGEHPFNSKSMFVQSPPSGLQPLWRDGHVSLLQPLSEFSVTVPKPMSIELSRDVFKDAPES